MANLVVVGMLAAVLSLADVVPAAPAGAAPVTGTACAPDPVLPPDLVLAGYHVSAFNPPGEPSLVSGEFASPTGSNLPFHTQVIPDSVGPDLEDYDYDYTGEAVQFLFQGQEPQFFLLTTTGLWVWGDNPSRGNGAIRDMVSGKAIQQVPLPVPAGNVVKMAASEGVLAIWTTSGHVWVAGQEGRNNSSASMYGDDSSSTDTQWHQVETAVNTPLTGVVDVEVTGDAAFAITSTGEWYTWGEQSRLGNGSGTSDRTRATLMTKPAAFAASSDLVQIGMVYDHLASDSAYMALHANGQVFVMGGNSQGQLGLGNQNDTNSWTNMLNPDGDAPLEHVFFISGQNSEDKYPHAGVLLDDPLIAGNSEMLLMGMNDNDTITSGLGTPQTLPGSPLYHLSSYKDVDEDGSITEIDIEPLRLDVGGHMTIYYDRAQEHYAYTGHNSSGAFGTGPPDPKGPPEDRFVVSDTELEIISEARCEMELTSAVTGGPVHNGDGTYDIQYTVTVENVGNRDLSNVVIDDDLASSFGAVFQSSTLDSDSCAAATLAPDDTCSQVITVTIAPGASLGPWTSTASATAGTPSGSTTDDDAPDLVTTIPELPEIAVALVASTPAVNNGDGTYTVEYTVDATNTGNVNLESLTVDNGLSTTYGAALQTSTIVSDSCTGSTLNSSIPAGAGDSCSQVISVVVQPGTNLGPWETNATVGGTTASGGSASDVSNDILADPEGDGAADNSTPTEVTFTENGVIGLANEVTTGPTYNGDGTYDIVYTMIVANYGDVPLTSIDVSDNMAATFGSDLVSSNVQSNDCPATLAPTESCTYVVAVTVTQDTYAGPIDNSATVDAVTPAGTTVSDVSQTGPNADFTTDGNPNNDSVPTTVDLLSPSVSLVHVAGNAADGTTEYIDAAGDVAHTYDITNTGNTYLTDITVVDDKGTPGDLSDDVTVCTLPGPLEPGGTAQCNVDINASADATFTATVSGTPALADGSAITGASLASATDDAIVDLVSPSISIVDSTTTPIINPGETVTYTYDVENTGDTSLTNIVVVDDNGTPGDLSDDVTVCTLPGPLAAGASDSCSNDFVINADITQVGSVTANPTLADGTDIADIGDVTDSDPESVNVINPGLSIDTTTTDPIIYNGGDADFIYTVTNTGDDPLTGVTVTDAECTPTALDPASDTGADGVMDPGEIWTFNCTGTYTADTTSSASAAGLDSLSQIVASNTDTEPVNVINPEIDLVVVAGNAPDGDVEYIDPAGDVAYTYTITNTGDDPLTGVSVLDDAGAALPGCTFTTLAVGASETCSVTVNETADTTHTGSVSALDSLSGSVSDTDPADVDLVSPAVTLVAVAGNAPDGDIEYVETTGPVTFTYTVENVGDTDVDSINVYDSNGTPTDFSDDTVLCSIPGPMAPTDPAASCTSDIAISDDVLQTAIVVASPVDATETPLPDIADVTATDPAEVDFVSPAIAVANNTATPIINPDDTVTFSYDATNTGDTELINVSIVEDGGTASPADDVTICTLPGPIAAGATITCPVTSDFVISVDTTHNVTIVGTPSVAGLPMPDIGDVANTDDEFINVINPALAIETTTTTPIIYTGEDVTFTYAVTNTGDDPITSLGVTDSQCATPVFDAEASGNGDTLFEPGEVWNFTCTGTYTADFDSVAIASGLDSLFQDVLSDDDRLPIDVISPDIGLVVVAGDAADGDVEYIDGPGPVTYNYLVTNTGDDPLASVSVLDDSGNALPGCTFTTLAIGITQLCQVTVNETVDTTHTGSVSALDTRGGSVSDTDPADVELVNGSVALIAVAGNAADGDVEFVDGTGPVTFTYTVDNIGEESLDIIDVLDSNGTPGDLSDDTFLCSVAGPLAPADAPASCTADVVITADLLQTAIVVATPVDATATPFPGVSDVTATDPAEVNLVSPAVSVANDTATPIINPDETVTFSYSVTNTGDTDLIDIAIVDDGGTADPLDDVAVCTIPGPLTVGATDTLTCATADYVIAADTTHSVTVTATPSDGATALPDIAVVTNTDDELINVINPALAIDTTTSTPIIYNGDTATFTYEITNTGDDPISAAAVTDTSCASTTTPVEISGNGDALVDPGEVWEATCAGAYTADFTGSATVAGLDSLGQTVTSDPDTQPINVINPSVDIVTTAGNAADGETEYIDAAGPVTYTYVVTNTGDDPLTDVDVLDTTGTVVPGCTFPSLAPSASETCTLTVTENADITHTGSVSGLDSLGEFVTADDPAIVDLVSPAVSLVAVAGNAPDGDIEYVETTGPVTFTYTVDNVGDTDVDSIDVFDSNGTPADPSDDTLLCSITGPLAPTDAAASCTSDVAISADLLQTAIVVATPVDATATPLPDISDVSSTDPAQVEFVAPSISVANSTATPIINPDDTVTFAYEVTNTGDTDLIDINIVDDGGTVDPSDDVTVCTIAGPLAAGATDSVTCTPADYIIDADTTHTVTATGTPAAGSVAMADIAEVSATDTEDVNVINPALAIETTTTTPIIYTGDSATFIYTITNPGDDPITSPSIADTACSPASAPVEITGNGDALIDPGETWESTCTGTYTADFDSVATAAGLDSLAQSVASPNDTLPVDVIDPAIDLVVTAGNAADGDVEYIDAAGPVTYTYVVTNTGDDPLTSVEVLDTDGSPIPSCTFTDLAPGATETCSTTVNETADVTHTGSVSAVDSLAGTVSDTDPADVDLLAPAVTLVAVAGNAPDGDVEYVETTGPVTFTYTVDNIGDTAVDSIEVTDTADSSALCTVAGPLAVGASGSCTSDVAITADVIQTAMVTATPVDGAGLPYPDISDVTATDPAEVDLVSPAISVSNSTATPVINPGDTVTFAYEVTNTGDTDLIDIDIVDDGGTVDPSDDVTVCTIAGPLAPGATDSATCLTADYDISVDTTHTVTATGTPSVGAVAMPDISPATATDTEDINVINPALEIAATTTDPIIYRGDDATFVYTITNPGDDPVDALVVTDTICSPTAAPVEITGNGDAFIDPGEVWESTCTGSYTGDVTSSATVTGEDSLDQTVTSPSVDTPVNVIDPAISIDTSADPAATTPGSPIVYTHIVTNTGDDSLSSVVVTDDQGAAVSLVGEIAGNGDANFDPGEIWEYTSTLAVAPADDVTVVGTSTALDSLGNPVEDTDTAVTVVSEPPVADDDSATTNQGVAVDIDVLDGDVDPDGSIDPTSVSVTTPPSNGSVAVDAATGLVTYTPDPAFSGVDTFTYEVCDDEGFCDEATVTVTVNAGPITDPEFATTNEATPVNIDVLDGDVDPEGDPLTVTGFPTPPANGTAVVDADGTVTYTPEAGFAGTEVFTYEVCDDSGACASDTVTVTVNDTPIGVDDSAGTLVDIPVTVSVLDNDIDPDDNIDPTSVAVTEQPNNGTVLVDATTGEITYTPDSGFVGTDTFVYSFCDDAVACDTAVVTITVTDTNTAPTAVDDAAATTPVTPVTIGVVGNDTDPESNIDPSTVSEIAAPANGTITIDPATGEIEYTPNAGFTGQDTFEYEVCDTGGLCDTALVTVDVIDAPVATDDSVATESDTPVSIDVLDNDTAGTNPIDPTTVTLITPPVSGTIDIDPITGLVEYTPNAGFTGTDTFEYEICDIAGLCDTATVTVDVNGAVIADDDSATTLFETPVTIDVQLNDIDPEAGPLTTNAIVVAPANGIAVIDAAGTITYTPNAGFVGVDTFEYEVCDADGSCDTASVSVTTDGEPTAVDDNAVTTVGVPVAIDILGNDSDPEDNLDASSLSETTPAANGSVSFTLTGAAIYTPDAGFTGTDRFEYEVCDLAGQCATATVTVVVDDPLVNEPPVAGDDSAETSIDVPISISPLGNDVDPEDDPLVIDPTSGITSAPTSGGTAVVETDGTITYTPAPGFTGTDTFEYEVCDPSGECDTAVVSIDVNGPPITDDESVTTNPGTPVDIDVVDGDVDPDGAIDPTSVSIVTPPTNGTVAVDPATGVVTYTPADGYGGLDSFVYEVCDNDGLCAEGNVTVTVPFPPVAVDDTAAADENTPVDIPVVDNDTDADGTIDPTSVMIVALPSSGTVSVDGTTGVVTYTPDAGFSGVDSFVYEVCDNDGFCDQADIDVSVNGVPIVKDDESMTNEDVPVVIDVLINDTDVDGIDPTTVSIDSDAANGTLAIDPVTGAITYTPNPGFHGLDAFMYEVCDNAGLCNTASVSVDVNANPEPADDTAWTPQDTPVVVPVVTNDVDPDSPVDPTSVSIVDIPSNGSLTVNSASGEMTYTPNDGFHGTDTFTYHICDDLGACGDATVTVDVDGAPITQPDTVFTTLVNPVDVDVLANDTDPDSALDPASVVITVPPVNGTTTVLAGVVTYTPDSPITAQDSFMYEVCDVEGVCSTETVYVNPTLVSVSGRVFTDSNRDGELNNGEQDISGVVLNLFSPGADGVLGTSDDVLVDTASTASPYVFEDVLAGDYRIVMDDSTLPNIVYATDDVDGGADRSIAVTVATTDVTAQHFGEVPALLTGTLTDQDGELLTGAIVTLTDADGNVFEMVTGDDGTYRFEGVPNSRPLVAGVGTLRVEHGGTTQTQTVAVNGANVTIQNLVIEIVEAPPILAFTGASIGRLAALALLLILLGFAMLAYDRPSLAWRRRED